MPNLTDPLIRAAKPPERGQVMLTDSNLANFGIRISQGGSKTFVVILGRGRRKTIGRYPLMSLADARREARRILAEKTLGKIHPARTPFVEAVDAFLTNCATRTRPRTLKDYTRLLKHFPFGRTALPDIKPTHIISELKTLSPSEKQHAFACGRVFFRWCTRQHFLDHSPMENLEAPANGKSRERALSTDELACLWKATECPRTAFHAIVRLLVLTGQRRGEIGRLEWSWINEADKTITIPSSITKNKRTHTFPYGETAADLFRQIPKLLERRYVFPAARTRSEKTTVFNGWGKPKAALDKECAIINWTLHDLRRTFSSNMAALGVPQIVVEKLLNHISGGTQSPITQTYNRYAYMDEMRDAVGRWERYLQSL